MSAVATLPIERTKLRADAWEDYAVGTRGPRFAWFCETNLFLGQSQWAGRRMVLEPDWQLPMYCEALAVDENGLPYWLTVVIVATRKHAKTNGLSALASFELDEALGEPEILMAAGSDKQAQKLFGGATGFYRRNKTYGDGRLFKSVHLRDYNGQIAHVENGGIIHRLSADGDMQHGWNPSKIMIDELHAWRQPKHIRNWGALTTADGARNDTQAYVITTEGELRGRESSILGQLISDNEASGELERLPGLTISRDHESRTIIFHYHAASAEHADPRPLRRAVADVKRAEAAGDGVAELEAEVERLEQLLLESVVPANPASWITPDYLLKQARSAKVMPAQFMQLHANVAADMVESWILGDRWDGLIEDVELEDGEQIAMAVDASHSHDTTAVARAMVLPDGRIWLDAKVWSARSEAPAHEYQPGGKIDGAPIRDYILHHDEVCDVSEVAYDPAYFRESAGMLEDEDVQMTRMDQQTDAMRMAEQVFYDAVMEGRVAHSGDPVVRQHLMAVVASRRMNGSWRIRKADQKDAIDAVVAMIMAHDRATRMSAWDGALFEVLA